MASILQTLDTWCHIFLPKWQSNRWPWGPQKRWVMVQKEKVLQAWVWEPSCAEWQLWNLSEVGHIWKKYVTSLEGGFWGLEPGLLSRSTFSPFPFPLSHELRSLTRHSCFREAGHHPVWLHYPKLWSNIHFVLIKLCISRSSVTVMSKIIIRPCHPLPTASVTSMWTVTTCKWGQRESHGVS